MAAESLILKQPGAGGAEISLSNGNGFDPTATDFNGSSQYVTTTYQPFVAGQRTFMGWARVDTATTMCIGGNSDAAAFNVIGQITSATSWTSYVNATTYAMSANLPGVGVWFHWALAVDTVGDTITLYINGVSQGTIAMTSAWSVTNPNLQIGRFQGGQYFDGKMKWFSINETLLTAAQIAATASSAEYETAVEALPNLGILLPLDASRGLTDQSGNARNGTAVGAPTIGGYSPGPANGNWKMEALDLANPESRDEYLVGSDADGSLPARVPRLENRQVSIRLRAVDAGTMDAVLANIGAVAEALQAAEAVAAAGAVDPADYARLIYTPKDSTKSFFLPVYGGSIGEIPRTLDGSDAGFFTRVPVVNLSLVCGPAGFGPLRTYLATTATTLGPAPSLTVPGGPGDLPPWTREKFADNATKLRGRLAAGIRQGESATTAEIGIGAMTLIAGINFASYLTFSAAVTDWQTMASIPTQTRTGTFRVYATRAAGPAGSKLRLSWAEAGASRRTLDSVALPVGGAGFADAYLGEINPSSNWNAWIEGIGAPALFYILLIPTDSFIEAVGPGGGSNLVGAQISKDDLKSVSTHIDTRVLTTGGSWSVAGQKVTSPLWPVAATGSQRAQVSMSAAGFAIAGTINTLDVHAEAVLKRGAAPPTYTVDTTKPYDGVFARYADISNFLVAGLACAGSIQNRLIVSVCVAGTYYPLWISNTTYSSGSWTWKIELEATSDGRWSARFRTWDLTNNVPQTIVGSGYAEEKASGYHGLLIAGEALGAATARTGLFDYIPTADAFGTTFAYFRANALAGLTPPPIPSGSFLTLAGPEMVTASGGKYPYAGASGLTLKPGVNNNLTILARRSAGDAGAQASGNETDSLNVTIDGYPRFSSIPY